MDRITESLLKEFVVDQSLDKLSQDVAFERFANFCVVSSEYSETFSVEDISSGSGNDCGLDGIAIVLNGVLVTSEDEVKDIVEANKYADATFIFVQAKTTPSFNGGEIGTFLYGAKDYFSDAGSLIRNDFVKQSVAVQQEIYKLSARMTKGKPACKLFYVTTGKWTGDPNLTGRYQTGVKDIEELGIFRSVEFTPVDADSLYRLYQQSKNKVAADFNFSLKTVIPDIPGVAEAYIGMIPAEEYIGLIADPNGRMRKSLFYDNVRDFLDYNPVNADMRDTIQSNEEKAWFALLNNGVTIIAKSLRTVGNRFHIEDYQVVNGCQTSHVLYDEKDNLGSSVYVPLKVIATTDDNVTNAIIKATNHQTEVKAEQLYALSDFQKNLEAFFDTYPDKKRLYYERRSRQYSGVTEVEKVRVISMTQLIRVFSAMFLDEPHRATRNYSGLLRSIGTDIFAESHLLEPYYASAFAHYRLEFLFRNYQLESVFKVARFHILMIARHQMAGAKLPAVNSRDMKRYSENLLSILWDDQASYTAFIKAAEVVRKVSKNNFDRDIIRTQQFTNQVLAEIGSWPAGKPI